MSSSPPTITVTGASSHQDPHRASPFPPTNPPSPAAGSTAADPGSEKHANSPASTGAASAAAPLKPRSCVVCRTRKVRCSREDPCSNCRRAGIPCIFPSNDRPPRWARRLDRAGLPAAVANAVAGARTGTRDGAAVPAAAQVMDRVHNLESLVKELRAQLDQANAATAVANAVAGAAHSAGGSATAMASPGSATHTDGSSAATTSNVQEQFGRLVVSDDKHSLYVSSGFWSRVNDELDGLKMDTQGLAADESDVSEDDASPGLSPSTNEYERSPAERHAFVFRHNLNPSIPDSRVFQPLPYQVSFLVDVFAENVNSLGQVVHMPTISKIVRSLRASSPMSLDAVNETLMFSIYYAAVTAMEEDDILTNFGSSKAELSLKYRLGFEHALAKADFLHVSDLVLVQALSVFLLVGRRHDSPSFIWMMTGLAIRMGQALGLHRDPSRFENLTPYEVEIRRRIWWILCVLDVRSSEDQRAELTIVPGSFDTKIPSNLNDSDIDPESKQIPVEREGITDMTFARIAFQICEITRRIVALGTKDEGSRLEEQSQLLDEMHESLQRSYLQHSSEPGNIAYWGWIVVVRLTVAKMTLITHLPALFASPSEHFSDDIRNKLLVAAIEIAEHNHALSIEPQCRQWRWMLQTYTHWHAVVYLLIEMARRPWSPIVERAWLGLQSPWLIPTHQFNIDQNLRVWIPLRKLMAKARKHREAELERLRNDEWAARRLEAEDSHLPLPRTPGPYPIPAEERAAVFRERWWKQINLQRNTDPARQTANPSYEHSTQEWVPSQPVTSSEPQPPAYDMQNPHNVSTSTNYPPTYIPAGQDMTNFGTGQVFNTPFSFSENLGPGQGVLVSLPTGGPAPMTPAMGDGQAQSSGVLGWLWADADPAADMFSNVNMDAIDVNMDLEGEVDWSRWLESAQGMEMDIGQGGPA